MLGPLIARVVEACVRAAGAVALLALVASVLAAAYAVTHFAINTDTTKLVSPEVPWRKAEARFQAIFPQPANLILIVIDGATPERAQQAAAALSERLSKQQELFLSLREPGGGAFFERNGLLYLPLAQTQSAVDQLIAAQPFLGALAADPSLRGVMDAFSTALVGVERGQITLERLARPMRELEATLATSDQHRMERPLSWRKMMMEGEPDLRETRRVIEALVAVDFGALEPGAKPSSVIRETVRHLQLPDVRVRLTGPVPIFDEEFATLTERALPIAATTIGVIVLMLWLALKSWRLIMGVMATILTGLLVTTALGLFMVGAFNIISVAFVALFVGLGVDFGIQFGVRYRAERHAGLDLEHAIVAAAGGIGPSLTLAAFAITAGFLGFLPTSYRGVAELGLIAGTGMLLTFFLTLTLLPALIKLLAPAREGAEIGFAGLARFDRLLLSAPGVFVGLAAVLGVAAVAVLPALSFDFNLLNLRSREVESISTLLDLAHDPDRSPNAMDALTPTREAAAALAVRLRALPEVAKVITIDDFIPQDQDEKLALIADAALVLDLSLNPIDTKPAPSDAEIVASLRATAGALRKAAATASKETMQLAGGLAIELERLAGAEATARETTARALTSGLPTLLNNVRNLLTAEAVTLDTLPKEIARDFIAPSGHVRVRIYPKGDPTDNAILMRFVTAVATVAPQAVGVPLSLEESGRTITGAFAEAGFYSLAAIAILLALALGRLSDVMLALAPLVLAGALTLATCVVIGMKLNYANIIALPLLFGIGVAFDIYFVMAWRNGNRALLEAPLTRAVMFSAGATAAGFGALWFSSHPGTSSMGALLMISLGWILFVVLVVLPPLLQLMRPSPKRS